MERRELKIKVWGLTRGPLYYASVIPGGLFVLVLGIIYAKFLFSLPKRTRNLILLSAVVYLSSAVGMELLGGFYVSALGDKNILYAILTTVEETAEMLGVVVFIHALLDYINANQIRLYLGND